MTTFVDNLRKELEATFKEDISIYFDENPHDGLLEIHDVNKSPEGKFMRDDPRFQEIARKMNLPYK